MIFLNGFFLYVCMVQFMLNVGVLIGNILGILVGYQYEYVLEILVRY